MSIFIHHCHSWELAISILMLRWLLSELKNGLFAKVQQDSRQTRKMIKYPLDFNCVNFGWIIFPTHLVINGDRKGDLEVAILIMGM